MDAAKGAFKIVRVRCPGTFWKGYDPLCPSATTHTPHFFGAALGAEPTSLLIEYGLKRIERNDKMTSR